MEAREYRVDNFIVLELKGHVDEFNTAILRDEIHTIINTGRSRLAVDLSRTEFVSAHCLAAVWRCQRRARRYGGDIVLFGARGKAAETIRFVSLDRVMTIATDLDGARDHFVTLGQHQIEREQESLTNNSPGWSWRRALARFFQFMLLFNLALLTTHEPAQATPEDQPSRATMDRKTLRELLLRQGSVAKLASLERQERLQDRDITHSLQLPKVTLTTGYLYQTNPNLLTKVANRELNQLRQRGSESEFSDFQSNTNFRIDKDVVVVSVGLVQVLYSGGLYEAQMKLADSRIKEQEAKALVDKTVVAETADKLYWAIVLGERKVELLEAQLQVATAQKAAKAQSLLRRSIGRSEAAEAELAELVTQKNVLEAKQELTKARETLSAMLGRMPQDTLVLAPEVPSRMKVIHEPEAYLKIAENRYADLAHAAARIDSARAYEETVAASAVRSPKAFALGAVDHSRGLGDNQEIINWTVGLAVTMPLYDGGRSYAELEKTRLLLAQARLGYEEARRNLHLGLREAVSGLRSTDIRLTIAEKARELAGERIAAAEQAAAKGMIPAYQVMMAKQAALEADIVLVAAQAEYAQWRARLASLTGEDL